MDKLICGIFLSIAFAPLVYTQPSDNHLSENQVDYFNTYELQNRESFPMLDSVLPSYSFFFSAEEHWLDINTQVQYEFLVFLHRKAGVKNLILEGGFSYAFMINEFLETGNEWYLNKALYNPPVCPEAFTEFFRKIYAYNRRLPPLERIQVVGIDLEQSPQLVINCLNELLPNKPLSSGVKDKMEQLLRYQLTPKNDIELRKYFRQLQKEVQIRRRAYRRYWGNQYWLFKLILDNTIQGFDSPLLRDFIYAHSDQKHREERMFQNFTLLKTNGRLKGNSYAQFGGIHTELNPAINWGYSTLAQRLNTDKMSPVQNQVLTFSKYFRRVKRIYERFEESQDFSRIMDDISAKMKTDFALCRIAGNPHIFPNIGQDFQFMLVIRPDKEINRCE